MDDLYREEILDHYKRPRRLGPLAQATNRAERINPLCGDTIQVELIVADGRIKAARFIGQGCAISQAAADIGSEALVGLSLDTIAEHDEQWMLDLLGLPLSTARHECGVLWWKTMRDALANEQRAAPKSAD